MNRYQAIYVSWIFLGAFTVLSIATTLMVAWSETTTIPDSVFILAFFSLGGLYLLGIITMNLYLDTRRFIEE